jgi:methylated-DNA-[protein]-cysteine S-methyltransferase
MIMTIQYCFTDSPVGRLLLVGNHQGLLKINFQDGHTPMLPESNWRKDAAFFMTAIIQLNEYFSGKRKKFSIRLNMDVTDFQKQVLALTSRIPYGEIVSYSDIAKACGKPKSIRAVGIAISKNPFPILIPCHRTEHVTKKTSDFVGGEKYKAILLDLEKGTNKDFDEVSSRKIPLEVKAVKFSA